MKTLHGIDWVSILLVSIIVCFGIINVYSVNESFGKKQFIWAAAAVAIIMGTIIATYRNKNFFESNAVIFYGFCILLLIGLFPLGKEINGAKAWYSIGGKFSIQPAEFAKIATALMIAYVLSMNNNMGRQPSSSFFKIAGILAVPMVLILLQPDLGSLIVFGALILALFREGLSPWLLLIPIIFAAIFLGAIVWHPIWLCLSIGYLVLLVLLLFLNFSPYIKQGYYLEHIFVSLFISLFLYFVGIIGLGVSHGLVLTENMNFENINRVLALSLGGLGACISLTLAIVMRRSENKMAEIGSYDIRAYKSKRPILQPTIGFSFIMLSILFICAFSPFIFDHLPTHQKERVMVLFEGEEKYPKTAGYNLLYSKVAIGSGELTGRGWNSGPVTDGRFVPEQHTDYIFSTVGEEWGFLGTSFLIIVYVLFILRLYYLAESQKTVFGRYFGNAVASILLLHFFLNIAMVTGLFPTVGIPLPFFSYGGSSLWAFSLLVFIFLKLNYEDKQSLI